MIEYKAGTTPLLRFSLSDGAGVTLGDIVVKLAKADGVEFDGAGVVSEIGNGLYQYAASATDMGSVGMLSLVPVVDGTADVPMAYQVVSHTRSEVVTAVGALNDLSAAGVRAELGTELGRIDVAVSSRNEVAPDNASVLAIKAKTDNLPAVPAASGDAMTLTPGERDAVAVEVESHLLDEGDSQPLINALVAAIGNANVDEAALVAAIRVDLERAGGLVNQILTDTDQTIPGLIAALNDHDGSDSAGVTTLLARVTAVRAGYLDELDGLDVEGSAAAALVAYDAPTRGEATADKAEIIARGDAAWLTGGGGSGGSGASAAQVAAAVRAELALELGRMDEAVSAPKSLTAANLATLFDDGDAATQLSDFFAGLIARFDDAGDTPVATIATAMVAALTSDAGWVELLSDAEAARVAAVAAVAAVGNLNDVSFAQLTAEAQRIIDRGNLAWITGGGGAGGGASVLQIWEADLSNFAAGTAGALVSRLNVEPAEVPVIALPVISNDEDLCTIYLDVERGDGAPAEGVEVVFKLLGDLPQLTVSGKLVTNDVIVAKADALGRVVVFLEIGLTWNLKAGTIFGRDGLKFTVPDEDIFELNSLVS